jgi:hypothetical protein
MSSTCTELSLNLALCLCVMYLSILTFTSQKCVDPKSGTIIVSPDHNEGVFLIKAIRDSSFVTLEDTPSS